MKPHLRRYGRVQRGRGGRDFPAWAADLAKQPDATRPKKLAMYCTGGIRCEKATALMQDFGFDEVYHLEGGILKYFEEVPAEQSKWHGECFVFDGRVAVDHALRPGSYQMCHACRMPLSEADLKSVNDGNELNRAVNNQKVIPKVRRLR